MYEPPHQGVDHLTLIHAQRWNPYHHLQHLDYSAPSWTSCWRNSTVRVLWYLASSVHIVSVRYTQLTMQLLLHCLIFLPCSTGPWPQSGVSALVAVLVVLRKKKSPRFSTLAPGIEFTLLMFLWQFQNSSCQHQLIFSYDCLKHMFYIERQYLPQNQESHRWDN